MIEPMALGRLLIGVALALLAMATPATGRIVPGDAFLCADARVPRATRGAAAPPAFHPRVAVPAIDRFTRPLPSGRYTLDLRRADAFCRPARLDDAELIDPLHGLELYEARRTRRKPAPPPLPAVTETLESAFGTVRLKLAAIATLAVPTMATGSVGGGATVERDHFACYQARPERAVGERPRPFRTVVQTSDGPRTVDVRKPIGLCVPASVRGEDPSAPKHPVDLLCYDARVVVAAGAPALAAEVVATRNGFGHELLKLGVPQVLCVPAARPDVAVPTPTPFPTFTPPPTAVPSATPVRTPRPAAVRIEPTASEALLRDPQCFTAVADFPDGTTADVTATAAWRAADGTLAASAGFVDGKKCFLGIGIGTTTITARDVTTGATSSPARLAATWPIFQLVVSPKYLGMRLGENENLTVTAHLTGNRTRNVTQYVLYESSNPAVASMPNAAGNRSRIEAASVGTSSVVVSDTFSSLSDTTSVAVGEITAVEVEVASDGLLFPGEVATVKAIGIFSGGFRGNVSSVATFDSSAPHVALAEKAPDARGRITAIAPGTAVIAAIDGPSGLRSTCCGTVQVLGDALHLMLVPTMFERRLGVDTSPLWVTASGTYVAPPSGTAFRFVSGRVAWSSSDEAVVAIGDVDDRGRRELLPVGGGQATVVATDPSNGLTSAPATVTVYEHLDRVEVGTSPFDPAENAERTIIAGQSAGYYAYGYFDGGRHLRLSAATIVSSDPTIAYVYSGRFVEGVRPGTVTISALDRPSGLSSADGGRDAVLHVIGGLVQIAVTPPTVMLGIGQVTSLTTNGIDAFGTTENLTQRVLYTSSDPTVVVAENEPGNRSRIRAVGVGTATISAYDALSGLTSGQSGGDATVTVRDGRLERIVVSPATVRLAVGSVRRFSAIGHLNDGDAVNLTQKARWLTSDPAVAGAPNAAGDRSRIDALAPGTVTVTAEDDATGISSTDTGEDATLTIIALAALDLAPTDVTLRVGERLSLTALGRDENGDTVNLTQEATYASSDPGVVAALNASGNRSQIEAVAPGVATVTAIRPSAYPQATESAPVTITVVTAE